MLSEEGIQKPTEAEASSERPASSPEPVPRGAQHLLGPSPRTSTALFPFPPRSAWRQLPSQAGAQGRQSHRCMGADGTTGVISIPEAC